LAAALLLRASDHAIFAWWSMVMNPTWLEVFRRGATFGLIDGALGLAVVGLLVPAAVHKAVRPLVLLTFVDAVGRLGVGLMLLLFPGIPITAVTIVPFFGVIGASAAILGIVAMIFWLVGRFKIGRRWTLGSDLLFDPLAIAAILSYAIAYTLFLAPPATTHALRMMAARSAAVMAGVFLAAALGALAYRGHAPERVSVIP
jgi:hypothetical protein